MKQELTGNRSAVIINHDAVILSRTTIKALAHDIVTKQHLIHSYYYETSNYQRTKTLVGQPAGITSVVNFTSQIGLQHHQALPLNSSKQCALLSTVQHYYHHHHHQ